MADERIARGECVYLVVNADDFGYSESVSRGIVDAARDGAITATGIMANSLRFDECVEQLGSLRNIDAGVHLNITYGRPLTEPMARRCARWGGRFPGKFGLTTRILTGQIPVGEIANEWRAQVRRCLDADIVVTFLNSHEHIHLLPSLFKAFLDLAKDFHVPFIRYPEPEWSWGWRPGGVARNVALTGLNLFNGSRVPAHLPKLLGLEASGRLSLEYLQRLLPRLEPNHAYELMCHPGYRDAGEIQDRRVLSYHDWEGELRLLTSDAIKELRRSWGVRITRYSELPESR